MNIVFFGTPEPALPSLEKLIAAGHSIKLVVTQPDRPAGRGQKVKPPPVKTLALRYQLPVIQPDKIRRDKQALDLIRSLSPDIIVVVAFGQLLPAELIYFPPFKAVNVHFSLLPKYRGACPVAWALLNGEEKTGVTIFQLNEKMDEGDILSQIEVPILPEENAEELERRLAVLGADLLLRTLDEINQITPRPQNHSLATYAPKIEKDQGRLDWTSPAARIDRQVRALYPWPGAFTYCRGELVKVHRGALRPTSNLIAKPGEIICISHEGVDVACGDHQVYRLEKLQRENRCQMGAYEFSLGMRLKPGELLG